MPLATKLARPRLPLALIVRERLLRQLATLPAHRLTLLSAAAGWGQDHPARQLARFAQFS